MIYKIKVLTQYLPVLPEGLVDIEGYYEKESKVCPLLVTVYELPDGLEVGKVYYDPEYCHIYKVLEKISPCQDSSLLAVGC